MAYHLLMGMLIPTCMPSLLDRKRALESSLALTSLKQIFYQCDLAINTLPSNGWCNRGAVGAVE